MTLQQYVLGRTHDSGSDVGWRVDEGFLWEDCEGVCYAAPYDVSYRSTLDMRVYDVDSFSSARVDNDAR